MGLLTAAAPAPAHQGSAYADPIHVAWSPNTPPGPPDRWHGSTGRYTRSPASEGVADPRPGGRRAEWAAAEHRRPPGEGRPVEGCAFSHPPDGATAPGDHREA